MVIEDRDSSRRYIVAIACVLVLFVGALSVLVGAPAHAAPVSVANGVPGNGLPACDNPRESGGWDDRDFTATGNTSGADTPVRPRSMRIGEPCVHEGEYVIPSIVRDVPVDPIDEDDDGIDDLPDSVDGTDVCNEFTNPPTSPGSTMTAVPTVRCIKPVYWVRETAPDPDVYSEGGTLQAHVIPSPTDTKKVEVVVVRGHPAEDADTQYRTRFSLYCRQNTAPFSLLLRATTALNRSDFSSFDLECGSGSVTAWIVVAEADIGGPGNSVWGAMWFREDAPPDGVPGVGPGYYGGTAGAEMTSGDVSSFGIGINSLFECASTYGGPTTILPVEVGNPIAPNYVPWYETDDTDHENPIWQKTRTLGTEIDTTECKYLVRIEWVVCSYVGTDETEFGCVESTWTAQKWRENPAYPGGGSSQDELLCELYPNRAECFQVHNPTRIDGTDFGQVCADPPEMAWLDFSWIPETIGHYADCLFTPRNGLDRLGWVKTAWQDSALGEVGDVVGSAVSAFEISESCGVIIDATGTPVPMVVNTCEWGWAETAKTAIGVAVTLMFAFWVLQFSFDMVLSVVNRVLPTPLKGDGA